LCGRHSRNVNKVKRGMFWKYTLWCSFGEQDYLVGILQLRSAQSLALIPQYRQNIPGCLNALSKSINFVENRRQDFRSKEAQS